MGCSTALPASQNVGQKIAMPRPVSAIVTLCHTLIRSNTQGEAEDEAEVEIGAENVAEGQEEAEDWDVGGEKRSREHRRKHGGKKVDLGEVDSFLIVPTIRRSLMPFN